MSLALFPIENSSAYRPFMFRRFSVFRRSRTARFLRLCLSRTRHRSLCDSLLLGEICDGKLNNVHRRIYLEPSQSAWKSVRASSDIPSVSRMAAGVCQSGHSFATAVGTSKRCKCPILLCVLSGNFGIVGIDPLQFCAVACGAEIFWIPLKTGARNKFASFSETCGRFSLVLAWIKRWLIAYSQFSFVLLSPCRGGPPRPPLRQRMGRDRARPIHTIIQEHHAESGNPMPFSPVPRRTCR